MRIGLASVYSWRPHVRSLIFLSNILKNEGHEVFFMSCKASVPTCYSRAINERSKLVGCGVCWLSGINSFDKDNITEMSSQVISNLTDDKKNKFSESSLATIYRAESEDYLLTEADKSLVKGLSDAVDISFSNTINWIKNNQLEAIICFNGRMDITRGIIEGAKVQHIPFLTYEFSWFGNGIFLVPNENCLSLKLWDDLCDFFITKPLLMQQAIVASSFLCRRINRTSFTEWRQFNIDAKKKKWPGNLLGERVLILPSSRNEFYGHEDFSDEWDSPTDGFENVLKELNVDLRNCVLRCHPIWSQKIGSREGDHIEERYIRWAQNLGIEVIRSNEKIDSFSLMEQCDYLLLNGSSAALEAGILGKKIISITPSQYRKADISVSVFSKHALGSMREKLAKYTVESIRTNTLRFMYIIVGRASQYNEFVKAVSPTKLKYFEGASAEPIITALTTGKIPPGDSRYSLNQDDEDEIIRLFASGEWDLFLKNEPIEIESHEIIYKRRFPYSFLNLID